MMADSSFDANVTTKMLMPHEICSSGTNSNVNTTNFVAQHSLNAFSELRHDASSSFYHSTASTTVATTGFNGLHNSSFHNNYSQSGVSTNLNSTFNTLTDQQHPILLSNHNSNATVSTTMPPPLILYNQPHQNLSLYTNTTLSNTNTNVAASRLQLSQKINEDVPAENESTKSNSNERNQQLTTTLDTSTIGSEELCTEEGVEEEPEIDIVISNVVCAFSVRCHLSLKHIALQGANVEFKRENGMVTMKLRKPYTTASIWSSGKITCTGATSEEQAKIAARRYARMLQKLNFRVRFQNYRVVNVLGTCKMPWAIKIVQFSEKYKKEASYEPELHPGVTYNLKNPTATLKIFSTGSMTVTARSVADVQAAIEHIYPLVYEFKKLRVEGANEMNGERDEEVYADIIETDIEIDDSDEGDDDDEVNIMNPPEDPLDIPESSSPSSKKQKLRDVSHLTKRYKGPTTTTTSSTITKTPNQKQRRRGSKRPLGKMNDPKQDLIYVSDGDVDGDDF